MNDTTELDLLAPLGEVEPPDEDAMRGIAALFVAEAAKEPPVRRRRGLLLVGGVVGAAAAIVGVVSLIGGLTAPPSSSDVHELMLTAFDESDAILHEHTVITGDHSPAMITDEWFSTTHPVVGQRVTHRGSYTLGGKPEQDSTETYVIPPTGTTPANCPAGTGRSVAFDLIVADSDSVVVDLAKRNWSKQTDTCTITGLSSVTDVRQKISSGEWQLVPGTTTADGRRAIELTTVDGDSHWTLFADADTYLPIRGTMTSSGPSSITTEYVFLPNTPENRKQLQTPIPPGYPQVTVQQQQQH